MSNLNANSYGENKKKNRGEASTSDAIASGTKAAKRNHHTATAHRRGTERIGADYPRLHSQWGRVFFLFFFLVWW